MTEITVDTPVTLWDFSVYQKVITEWTREYTALGDTVTQLPRQSWYIHLKIETTVGKALMAYHISPIRVANSLHDNNPDAGVLYQLEALQQALTSYDPNSRYTGHHQLVC